MTMLMTACSFWRRFVRRRFWLHAIKPDEGAVWLFVELWL